MPGPVFERGDDRVDRGRHSEAAAVRPGADSEVALSLPNWDLLPPAEFLDRHSGGR